MKLNSNFWHCVKIRLVVRDVLSWTLKNESGALRPFVDIVFFSVKFRTIETFYYLDIRFFFFFFFWI